MRDLCRTLADFFGFEVLAEHNGEEGTVAVLAGGSILKITASPYEGALCLALMREAAEGITHRAIPIIHTVARLVDSQAAPPEADDESYFAIIREDFLDFEPSERGSNWQQALAQFRLNWLNGRPPDDNVSDPHFQMGIRDLHSGLYWMRERLGVTLSDIRPENLGLAPSGWLGIRDLGRGRGAEKLLHLLDEIAIWDLAYMADPSVSAHTKLRLLFGDFATREMTPNGRLGWKTT